MSSTSYGHMGDILLHGVHEGQLVSKEIDQENGIHHRKGKTKVSFIRDLIPDDIKEKMQSGKE